MTVLGDDIAMIIDPRWSKNQANISFKEEVAVKKISELVEENKNVEEKMILLFKTSGSEILGIDMSAISRVQN